MSSRTVNLTLLTLLTVELISGLASFLVGTASGGWVFWVHRAAAFGLLVLFGWKLRIIARSYRRRGLTGGTALSAALLALLLATFVYGLAWATVGIAGTALPGLGELTGLGLHVLFALALVPLLLVHAAARWRLVRLRRPDFASRRAALRYLGLAAVGLAGWRGSEVLSRLAGWSGAQRRFTGSREVGTLSGNRFPETIWLTDTVPTIDPETWRLRVVGSVEHPLSLRRDDLAILPRRVQRVVLDCTGGWYTTQDWGGVPVSEILARASVAAGARSLVVHSATGYRRRFALGQADQLLLADRVGDELLSAGHGGPLRLVATGRRGDAWVKWLVALEVSDEPAWWQSPLPLQ